MEEKLTSRTPFPVDHNNRIMCECLESYQYLKETDTPMDYLLAPPLPPPVTGIQKPLVEAYALDKEKASSVPTLVFEPSPAQQVYALYEKIKGQGYVKPKQNKNFIPDAEQKMMQVYDIRYDQSTLDKLIPSKL